MYIVLLAISTSCLGLVIIKKVYTYFTNSYRIVEPIDVYDFTDDIELVDSQPNIDGIKKSLEPSLDAI
jgi:hypothetical protein